MLVTLHRAVVAAEFRADPVDNPTLDQVRADPSRSGRNLTARQEPARADDTDIDPDVTDTRGRTRLDHATECTCHIGKYLS